MGLWSLGAGKYFFRGHWNASLHYGRTRSNNGADRINTLSMRNSVEPIRIRLNAHDRIVPYVGFSLGYSGETPMPFNLFIGTSWRKHLKKAKLEYLDVFAEMGTTGISASYTLEGSKVSAWDIMYFGLGAKLIFERASKQERKARRASE